MKEYFFACIYYPISQKFATVSGKKDGAGSKFRNYPQNRRENGAVCREKAVSRQRSAGRDAGRVIYKSERYAAKGRRSAVVPISDRLQSRLQKSYGFTISRRRGDRYKTMVPSPSIHKKRRPETSRAGARGKKRKRYGFDYVRVLIYLPVGPITTMQSPLSVCSVTVVLSSSTTWSKLFTNAP